jgi:hypothetical protein
MNPTEVDDLNDVLWDAMVRHMQREADAIRAASKRT